MNDKIIVYVAGPLFSPAERRYLEEITNQLEDLGFKTYLPHRDAGLAINIKEIEKKLIFKKNLEEINKANMMVVILNGLDVDSGTAFEMGCCFMQRKPIYGLVEDIRIEDINSDFNLMISYSTNIFQSKKTLFNELQTIMKNDSLKNNTNHP